MKRREDQLFRQHKVLACILHEHILWSKDLEEKMIQPNPENDCVTTYDHLSHNQKKIIGKDIK
jgi:hypothetical protein